MKFLAEMKRRLSQHRLDLLISVGLFLIAAAFRIWMADRNQVTFYWDQARDAILVREISQGDLKIQGPSASGSNDLLYHGVLYYYLIAPVYALGGGDPIAVVIFLSFLGATAAPLMYWLARDITRSRFLAGASAFMVALSFDGAQIHTWLSNPAFSGTANLLFFYALWRVFFQKQNRWLPVLAAAIGLANQSVLFSVTLWASMVIAFLYRAEKENTYRLFSRRQLAVSSLIYFGLVASIMVGELQLWQAGILDWQKLIGLFGPGAHISQSLKNLSEVVIEKKMSLQIFPSQALFGIAATIFVLVAASKKLPGKTLIFISIWLASPLWLFFIQARRSYHAFAGWENAWYLIFPIVIWSLFHTKAKYWAVTIFLSIFTLSNLSYVRKLNVRTYNELAVQQEADLRSHLKLINETYRRAGGEPFSISTLTIPYGMNTTWAYLFDWYGQKNYGYEPVFFGPDQTGIFGGDLLKPTQNPLPHHFAIIESDVQPEFDLRWLVEQEVFSGTPSAFANIDGLRLYEYRSTQ